MTAIFTFAAVIVGASSLGWLIRSLTRGIVSRAARISLSIAAGVSAFAGGILVMSFTGLGIPAADDSMFGERTRIKAEFFCDSSLLEKEDFRIDVIVPRAVRVENDAVLDFVLGDERAVLQPGTYSTVLESSDTVKIRTTNPCNSRQQDTSSGVNSIAACNQRTSPAPAESHFRWFIRSSKPGESYVSVRWPEQIASTINVGHSWVALLKRNDESSLSLP